MEPLSDTLFRRMLDALLGATALWSRRRPADEGVVAATRRALVIERHRRYVADIPVYRDLAEEQGLAGGADLRAIVDGMLLSTDVFKSYDVEAIETADFGAMTRWVAEVSTCRPRRPGPDVTDAEGWRADLLAQGVRLSSSSATSGQPLFVPRDRPTWAALCGNGRFSRQTRDAAAHDCLALMPRGGALGLQAAAEGLARRAERSHFLAAGALGDAVAFLASSDRPVVIFGTPFHVAALCEATGDRIPLAAGSRVVTGGGWKTATPIARGVLLERVGATLGLAGDAVVDAYSTTELNCVLSSCREGRYHVPPLVEPIVLDDSLEWIDDGEATGLLGFLDPFAGSYSGFLATGDEAHLTRARARAA